MRKIVALLLVLGLASTMVWAAGSRSQSRSDEVTIEFIQWWEPELPSGAFRTLMNQFESENPGIRVRLISGPYSNTRDQIVTGAATGTLSDVVGLDGAWVNDLAKQGAITAMDPLMSSTNFNVNEVAAVIKVDNRSYMFPVASFVYPIFMNLNHFRDAGIANPPQSRSEFANAARRLTNPSQNRYGWVLPLSMQTPNGVQNDVMSWLWASGGSMLRNGRPNLTSPEVIETLKFVDGLYKEGVVSPGTFSKQEQEKVEEFVNGRVGMTISSLAHINMIRERNPNLNFTISALPASDGYTGKRGLPYAAWGIGISENSRHKAEAWKLVSFLMRADINSKLVSIAHAFPGNVNARPDFIAGDELYSKAFEIFQSGYLANEFTGLPIAEELMRMFDEEIQLMLDGKQTAEQAAANAQRKWEAVF